MKKELVQIFIDNPFLDKTQIAKLINMNAGNFRSYVTEGGLDVTPKNYKKIKDGIELAYEMFGKSLGKS